MKKNDLVSGKHIVENRLGNRFLYLGGCLLGVNIYYDCIDLRDNLTIAMYKDFDIIKVYEIQYYDCCFKNLLANEGNLKLVWERKPELSEAERVILKSLNREYKWICRDLEGFLYIGYGSKPYQLPKYGWAGGALYEFPFKHLFQMVKWEDKEPTLIADLLEGGK